MAGPTVHVEAKVDLARCAITGRVTWDGEVYFEAPLQRLPRPPDDLWRQRTDPGRPDSGRYEQTIGERELLFVTHLPRRWDDLGCTARGLFANGDWSPLPDRPVLWDVRLDVGDAVGAVGDVAGTGVISWTGRPDRVPVAAMRGRITVIDEDGLSLVLLTRGRPRPSLRRRLTTLGSEAAQHAGVPLRGVVVEGPLRRRLARPGPGMLYASDRLFRVTGPLWTLHADAAIEAMYAAWLPLASPRARALAAASLAMRYHRSHPDLRGYARYGGWTPGIDALLADGQLPFAQEVLRAPWPTDPLRDDLDERRYVSAPASVIAARIELAAGPDASDRFADALLLGATPVAAAQRAGIPESWLDATDAPEDLRLSVAGGVASISRDAGAAEPIALRLDGEDRWLSLPAGALALQVPTAARRVVLDPQGLAHQDRRGDAWPPRWKLTATAWLDSINLSSGYAELGGWAGLRRTDSPGWTFSGSVWTGRQDIVGGTLAATRLLGTKNTAITRAHRLTAWVSPAWLNGRYYTTGAVPLAAGAGLVWTWETRVEPVFPLEGHRASVGVDGGVAANGESWSAVRGSAVGLWAPHPRLTFAGRATAGLAAGRVQQRLLSLGGADQLRSVAPEDAFGTRRWTVAAEARAVVARNLGVNLGLAWLDDVQLSAGAEVGMVDGVRAVGLTGGVGLAGDILGLDRDIFTVLVAAPLEGPTAASQVYVQWGQAF